MAKVSRQSAEKNTTQMGNKHRKQCYTPLVLHANLVANNGSDTQVLVGRMLNIVSILENKFLQHDKQKKPN